MPHNSRLARLIDLVPFINTHQGIAVSELARKFGVSQKEIEKDLWLLYMCGLPGQTPLELMEFAFEDGYVSVRNADELSQPRSLTQSELASLVIGLELLAATDHPGARNLQEKLSEKLLAKVSFTPSGHERNWAEISKAINQNEILNFIYNGRTRAVFPYEIYSENNRSYVRGYCKIAREVRTFNLEKISNLEASKTTELPPNYIPSIESKKTTAIKTHAEIRLVKEVLGDTEIVQYFTDGWFVAQIMSLGGAVEALDPKLREEIYRRALASQNLYLG